MNPIAWLIGILTLSIVHSQIIGGYPFMMDDDPYSMGTSCTPSFTRRMWVSPRTGCREWCSKCYDKIFHTDCFLYDESTYDWIPYDDVDFVDSPLRSLTYLYNYTDFDERDSLTSYTRDFHMELFHVGTLKYEGKGIPGQTKSVLNIDANYFRGKFVKSFDGETYIREDSVRSKQKQAFYSSFGLLRIFGQQPVEDQICAGYVIEAGNIVHNCTWDIRDSKNGTCEWKIGLEEGDSQKIYAVLVFRIEYELLNNSDCVQEKKYEASIRTANIINATADSENLENVTVHLKYISIVRTFPQIKTTATLYPGKLAGTLDRSSCSLDRSSCDLRLHSDPSVIHKAFAMIHMGLSSVLEGGVSDFKHEPEKKRQYQDFLIYWNGLTKLDLSNLPQLNNVAGYLEKVPNLRELTLANAGLSKTPDTIKKLVHIRSLNLSGNSIKSEDLTDVLISLPEIQMLDLSQNPLQSLDPLQGVLNATKLKYLYLKNCELTELSRDIFHQQSAIEILVLSGNPLKSLPSDLVSNMNQLNSLDISSTGLENGLRLNLGSIELRSLNLSWNSISEINTITTSGIIHELNLEGNQISEWDNEKLFVRNNERWVTSLNLAKNKIEVITDIMGRSLQQLDSVDLSRNPYDCNNCRVWTEMKPWLLSVEGKPRIKYAPACAKGGQRSCKTITLLSTPAKCLPPEPDYTWLVFIPFVVLASPLLVFLYYSIKYRVYMVHLQIAERAKLKLMRRAAFLYEKHFEYDVYLVHSPEDTHFANTLKTQLEKPPLQYRVLLPSQDSKNASDEVQMSRNVIVVVTNNISKCEYARDGMERTNFWILSGEMHNLIMLMVEGLILEKLQSTVRTFCKMYPPLKWRPSKHSRQELFDKLVARLGPSNYQSWQRALCPSPEPPTPPRFGLETPAKKLKKAIFSRKGGVIKQTTV